MLSLHESLWGVGGSLRSSSDQWRRSTSCYLQCFRLVVDTNGRFRRDEQLLICSSLLFRILWDWAVIWKPAFIWGLMVHPQSDWQAAGGVGRTAEWAFEADSKRWGLWSIIYKPGQAGKCQQALHMLRPHHHKHTHTQMRKNESTFPLSSGGIAAPCSMLRNVHRHKTRHAEDCWYKTGGRWTRRWTKTTTSAEELQGYTSLKPTKCKSMNSKQSAPTAAAMQNNTVRSWWGNPAGNANSSFWNSQLFAWKTTPEIHLKNTNTSLLRRTGKSPVTLAVLDGQSGLFWSWVRCLH